MWDRLLIVCRLIVTSVSVIFLTIALTNVFDRLAMLFPKRTRKQIKRKYVNCRQVSFADNSTSQFFDLLDTNAKSAEILT